MSDRREDAGDLKRGGLDSGRSIALQWFGLLVPPAAWLLNLEFGYSLAHAACHGSGMLPVHAATLVALALCAVGGLAALVSWRQAGSAWARDVAGALDRSRLLSSLGLGGALIFALIIVAQWIPAFMFDPCWRT